MHINIATGAVTTEQQRAEEERRQQQLHQQQLQQQQQQHQGGHHQGGQEEGGHLGGSGSAEAVQSLEAGAIGGDYVQLRWRYDGPKPAKYLVHTSPRVRIPVVVDVFDSFVLDHLSRLSPFRDGRRTLGRARSRSRIADRVGRRLSRRSRIAPRYHLYVRSRGHRCRHSTTNLASAIDSRHHQGLYHLKKSIQNAKLPQTMHLIKDIKSRDFPIFTQPLLGVPSMPDIHLHLYFLRGYLHIRFGVALFFDIFCFPSLFFV